VINISTKDSLAGAGFLRLAVTYLTLWGIVGAASLLMQLAVEIQALAGARASIPW